MIHFLSFFKDHCFSAIRNNWSLSFIYIYYYYYSSYLYFIFIKKYFYHLKLQYITIYNLQVFFIPLLYFRDIEIYLIHIDLMRKRCQLINVDVDVDVDANESSRQLVEDGITTRTWLVDSLFCVTCSLENNAFSVLDYVIKVTLHYYMLHLAVTPWNFRARLY